ncbi:hypothetical protein ACN27J_05400 [Solwaraspora sp. WMMB762]|uniref:hypothetical protein n=1 Tax=Solwaraspora sp. WMMB762 TaxID=3404120 RepID=UPI003B948142
MRDRNTGARVAGVCVFATPVRVFSIPAQCRPNSGRTGRVSIDLPGPGSYHLFALPAPGSPYGAQWVGPDGGTGVQSEARRITVAAGEIKSVPAVLLDLRATITGYMVPRKGEIVGGVVGVAAPPPGAYQGARETPIDDDGAFTIDWVGPYHWPLMFRGDNLAVQWSGGVAGRAQADLVPAVVGTPEPATYRLRYGGELTVHILDGPTSAGRQLVLYNSGSGEHAGSVAIGDEATWGYLRVSGGQHVKIRCRCTGGDRWYGGSDFATATSVRVRHRDWLNLIL